MLVWWTSGYQRSGSIQPCSAHIRSAGRRLR
jgi:hypothetical protein